MMVLVLCLSAGIHPIITSSSDEKLDFVRKLSKPGDIDTINHNKYPEWEKEVLRLTKGRGADVIVSMAGPKSLSSCLAAVARRGTISLVGFLAGFDVTEYPDVFMPIFSKTAVLR
jgi:NADPH:quinone reductase-like Zn-dependent oxidoreductase